MIEYVQFENAIVVAVLEPQLVDADDEQVSGRQPDHSVEHEKGEFVHVRPDLLRARSSGELGCRKYCRVVTIRRPILVDLLGGDGVGESVLARLNFAAVGYVFLGRFDGRAVHRFEI